MEALAALFLAVIALSALLQAALVAGAALGLKKAEEEVEAFAARYDQKVRPQVEKLESVSLGLAASSQGAVEHARRLELRISSVVDAVGRRVEQASGHVADSFDETSEKVETWIVPGMGRRRGLFAQIQAVWSGVRDGLALFRG